MSDRAAFTEARDAGLVRRNESRIGRARTVIGEFDQQVIVQPHGEHVRLTIADETGESFSTVRLTPEAAERLMRILSQTKTIVESTS